MKNISVKIILIACDISNSLVSYKIFSINESLMCNFVGPGTINFIC